ncbi:MAG: sigma-54-dependent Fis family transcriptional regulator, partial [Deltaproteobacteria bacterium]|nr:sigma-54-dependent Fis family transcriptional regulator [Deltaproteobacteria bacterium]
MTSCASEPSSGPTELCDKMKKPVVLIVDDEFAVRQTLQLVLCDGYETLSAKDGKEALATIKSTPVDIMFLDVMLPGMDGLEVLAQVKEKDPAIGVIMLSASDSAQKAVIAMKNGAYDYVTKPFDNDLLLGTLKRYVDWHTLKGTDAELNAAMKKGMLYGIVSKSPEMRKVFELIEKVGKTSSNVLITGASGTGKELVARAIQSIGERSDKPYVIVNCGAIPSELMESELFGHEKGSFTGATSTKIGKFEHADGGTVFLDEISALPSPLQAKLLRALQEKTFERVGGNSLIKVDIRVIAATNIDLEEAVRKGAFREDLFYRLKVVPIYLPLLRDRKG